MSLQDVNRTLVKNLGRNIIRKLVVKLEGNEIISIDDYDILYSYYDCWKCTRERHNAVFQGIVETDGQTENAIKHRINATDKAIPPADVKDTHISLMLLTTQQSKLVLFLWNDKICGIWNPLNSLGIKRSITAR